MNQFRQATKLINTRMARKFSSSEEYQEALTNFQEKNKAELQSQQKRKLQKTLQQIRQES